MVTLIKQWLCQKSNWLVALSAIVLGFSAPGYGLWPLAWIGLIPLLWGLSQCRTWQHAFYQGLLWGTLYHGVVLIWFLGMHPITWMGFHPIASIIITTAGWMVSAFLQGLIVGLIWKGLFGLQRLNRYWFLVLAPLCWVGGLWFLNLNPLGLPWGFLAYSQAPIGWIRQSTYTLTFWGLEYLIFLVNIGWFFALYLRKPVFLLTNGLALVMILLCPQLNKPPPSLVYTRLQPVALQGNLSIEAERLFISQTEKDRYYQNLIHYVLDTLDTPPGLILLPEGVVYVPDPGTSRGIPFQTPKQTAVLTGSVYPTPNGLWANGATLFQHGQPAQFLSKRYLVPFGETIPFLPDPWLINLLGQFEIEYGQTFAPGAYHQPPLKLGNIRIGPLICFEALYPDLVEHYQHTNTHLLVTFSNLGWYHQQPLLEKQFLAINQMRAAESGLPLILITNTGVSAMISEDGALYATAPSGITGLLTVSGYQQVPVSQLFQGFGQKR